MKSVKPLESIHFSVASAVAQKKQRVWALVKLYYFEHVVEKK